MKKLKVYGLNWCGTHRRIVAATSQKEAAAIIGTTIYDMRNYGAETGNKQEIEIAIAEPGAIFERPHSGCGEYRRVPRKEQEVE